MSVNGASETTDEPQNLTEATSAAIAAAAGPAEAAKFEEKVEKTSSRTTWIAVLVGIGLLVATILIGWGLYSLGNADESSLERLRDVAIIFAVVFFMVAAILFAALVAAFAYLVLVLKEEAVPAINQLTLTLNQIRGTTEFVTESVARPVIKVQSKVSGWRAAIKTVTGRK